MRGCKSDRIGLKLCVDCRYVYSSGECKKARKLLRLKVVNGMKEDEKNGIK